MQFNLSETNPFEIFNKWINEAKEKVGRNYNAFTLATVDENNFPNARILLYKDITDNNNLTFYTNYNSVKGQELINNPQACMVFYWEQLHKQIRVRGSVQKMPYNESNKYFETRDRYSQLGAIVSKQSQLRDPSIDLLTEVKKLELEFENKKIQCPENWGGYYFTPITFEFWVEKDNRLHDRTSFKLNPHSLNWESCMLYP